ncbi:hypothetical protein HDV05_006555 [Chytridiales sp. JEL 0842]|nr:hypothetical protein HDV05_006555 [Chytridiales sp. JEL 0842]
MFGWKKSSSVKLQRPDSLDHDFIQFMDEVNIQGDARLNMMKLDADKKKVLIEQWRSGKDALSISGKSREDAHQKTSIHQKQTIVNQYYRRKEKEAISKSLPPLSAIDSLSPTDVDRALEKALNDPDMNITGAAKANVLTTMTDSGKRLMLKQYIQKKDVIKDSPTVSQKATQLHQIGSSSQASYQMRSPLIDERLSVPPPSITDVVPKSLPPVPLQDTFYSAQIVQTGFEQFISQLADRNTSLKGLQRILSNFKTHLSLCNEQAIKQFTETAVVVLGQPIKGLEIFEVLLQRITEEAIASAKAVNVRNPNFSAARSGYADAVLSDELRLEAISCLQTVMNVKDGMAAALQLPSLIREIAFCMTFLPQTQLSKLGSESRIKSANLYLRIKVAEVLGSLCLLSDEGLRRVTQSLSDVSKLLYETSPFQSIIASLINPFVHASSVSLREEEDPVVASRLDTLDLIWDFRIAILIFIIGIVSASEETSERVALRSAFDAGGLRKALSTLRSWSPPHRLVDHIQLYDEDKDDDQEAFEEEFKRLNLGMSDAEEILKNLMDSATRLPDPQYSWNLILRSLSSLVTIANALSGHVSSSDPSLDVDSSDRRNDAELALKVVEKVGVTVAGAISAWYEDGKLADIPKSLKLKSLAHEVSVQLSSVTGVDVRLAHEVESSKTLKEELEKTRAQYQDTLLTVDNQQRVINEMRLQLDQLDQEPSKSSQIIEAAVEAATVSFRDEIKRLQDTISSLSKERDDALTRVNTLTEKSKSEARYDTPINTEADGFLAALPSLTIPEVGITMKSLEWTKVPAKSINKSVWKEIVDEAYQSESSLAPSILDNVELEKLPELFKKTDEFGNAVSAKSARISALSKKRNVMLLDLPRARNIGILLGSLRVSYEVIRDAVKKVDDNILTPEKLSILKRCLPTNEEIERVKAYEGNVEELGNAEQFIAAISQVDRFSQRVEAIHFRQRFSEEVAEVAPDLDTITRATKTLRTSSRFKKLLQAILIIGNFVNNGTFRGNTYGFSMDSLLKLRDMTCSDWSNLRERAPTMLHYVARRLDEVDPDLVDLKDELASIELASKVCIPALLESVHSLQQGVEQIKAELAEIAALPHSASNDWFKEIMEAFVVSAEVRSRELLKKAALVEAEVKQMFVYFGEDPSRRQSAPEDFFRVIWEFQLSLQKAYQENVATDTRASREGRIHEVSRRTQPSAMAAAIAERRLKLKPVRGAEPFAKRLTVRRYKGAGGSTPDSGDIQEFGRLMADGGQGFKSIIAARKTMRKLVTQARSKNSRGELSGLFDRAVIPDVQLPQDGDFDDKSEPSLEAPFSPTDSVGSDVPSAIKELLEEAKYSDA